MTDEIANYFDLIGIVIRNLHTSERIFDQYHQLEAVVTVHAEFTKARFICNSFVINT